MVALTVNSEALAELLHGNTPYDDKSVADTQISETIRFVRNHPFMEIAYSPADVRRIVGQNKLAVLLGMEVDRAGNLGKPGVVTNEQTVRAEIRRLHGRGIRYMFPIHLIDNSFGGAAVYDLLLLQRTRKDGGLVPRSRGVSRARGRSGAEWPALRKHQRRAPLDLRSGARGWWAQRAVRRL